MDIDLRKKQFTQSIVSDIKSKIKEFKTKKELARSERNDALDFVINKDLVNKFRKVHPLPNSPSPSITTPSEPTPLSPSKSPHITPTPNYLKRHFSHDTKPKESTHKTIPNPNISSKKAELIQSLIPKPKSSQTKITRTYLNLNNTNSIYSFNNNINQINLTKTYNTNNNVIKSQKQNYSFNKENPISLVNNSKPKSNLPPYLTYKRNVNSSRMQPTKLIYSNYSKYSNSLSKETNRELEEFSDFGIGSSSKKEYNLSKGKPIRIYANDVKPLLSKIKNITNEDIENIDKNVYDDLITLATVIKMKLNY